jgi:ketosteroid isomerase-like protein
MTFSGNKKFVDLQLRALVDERVNAIRSLDTNKLMLAYAPDVISFDVVNPLFHEGNASIRKRMEEWFASFDGAIGFEVHNVTVSASDDVGFCHFLSGVNGNTRTGGKIEMWFRTTLCLRKFNGSWKVTHEHNSVPFNMDDGKASLELKPW